ncbi:hypothetical protein F0562_034403 [Nyssa sinensis]|uniref:Uncharacterized protein n=1 Tax=Nyssa sinensis TaxID=561372 RepID=A0A5J5AIE1_9ASTE|nr:hypothetical protein F0562_034403 [Nyssa sinensis]
MGDDQTNSNVYIMEQGEMVFQPSLSFLPFSIFWIYGQYWDVTVQSELQVLNLRCSAAENSTEEVSSKGDDDHNREFCAYQRVFLRWTKFGDGAGLLFAKQSEASLSTDCVPLASVCFGDSGR